MKELLEHIIGLLVDKPERVQISELLGQKTVVFELRCTEKTDASKLIGKGGKNVQAIRNLLNVLAARNGQRALVEVID
jgi:predicted RNA-binding protein YlqC (UPF0109 family)